MIVKPPSFFQAMVRIAAKDLRAEMRSRSLISAMALFGVLTVMIFYYTLEGRPDLRAEALPAVLWVTVIFAGTQGLGRSLSQEHDRGTLDALLLAPISRSALFFGKLIVAWLFTLTVGVIVSGAMLILFNANLSNLGWWLMLVIGTLGFATMGTLLGSMAVHARARETTLPIIILPIALPIVIGAVNACGAILEGKAFSEWSTWAGLLASLDVIFLALSFLLFDYVVEE